MSNESLDSAVEVAIRSIQITNALSEPERRALFLEAFPGMEAMIALEPSLVQSHINKLARVIHAAEQQMDVRYDTPEDLYLACQNANQKLIHDGLKARGQPTRPVGRTH